MRTKLTVLILLTAAFAQAEAVQPLIVAEGRTIEMGGVYHFDHILISGTVHLTNDTILSSASDISISSGGTITWHHTTTNWITEVHANAEESVIAENGSHAWNLTLHSYSNIVVNGMIDLCGGAGQTHSGRAGSGRSGWRFTNAAERVLHNGGDGGDSVGGAGGRGGTLILDAKEHSINLRGASLVLSGGRGGNGGQAGNGGDGGHWIGSGDAQGADGGDGGDSIGGNGGAGGLLVIRTKKLYTDEWNCLVHGGSEGMAGQAGEWGWFGSGSWGSDSMSMYGSMYYPMASGGPWYGENGRSGESINGSPGADGAIDVIKEAESQMNFENGNLSIGLGMSSTAATYVVEYCTNLLSPNWQEVGVFSRVGETTRWIEPGSNRFEKAFYRILTIYREDGE